MSGRGRVAGRAHSRRPGVGVCERVVFRRRDDVHRRQYVNSMAVRIDEVVVKRRKAVKRNARWRWSLEPRARTGGPVPLLPAQALVLFEFFDAAFNDLGEAYGAAFPLRGLV